MSESKSQWLIFAIASGGCAALNGAFAKLVTTHLTTRWASMVSSSIGVEDSSAVVEYLVRGVRLHTPDNMLYKESANFEVDLFGAKCRLQWCDVGPLHPSVDALEQHRSSKRDQHECEFHGHGCAWGYHLQRGIAR